MRPCTSDSTVHVLRMYMETMKFFYFLFQALRKKQLIVAGKLGKFGKFTESTPPEIRKEFEM